MRALLLTFAVAASPVLADKRPLYVTRPLTSDDLTGRSLRELTLMRNWIYARRNNEFRRRWLREFFVAQKWYSPNQRAFLSGEWKPHRCSG